MAMTEGHKMELFILGLTFIGWIFVVAITFGIAAIWVGPYIQTTFANAYNSLKPVKYDEQNNFDYNEESPFSFIEYNAEIPDENNEEKPVLFDED